MRSSERSVGVNTLKYVCPVRPWHHIPLPVASLNMASSRPVSSGIRVHPPAVVIQMHRQGAQARQEEEDQARDQDLAKLGWRAQRHCAPGRRQGSSGECDQGSSCRFRIDWFTKSTITSQSKTPSIVSEYVNVSSTRKYEFWLY